MKAGKLTSEDILARLFDTEIGAKSRGFDQCDDRAKDVLAAPKVAFSITNLLQSVRH